MKWGILAACMLFATTVFAGSVRLVNDSQFILRAVIRGADGSYLGEMILNPEHSNNWSDNIGPTGLYSRSQTPYSVTWYCMDGGDYSFCPVVSSGATVSAQSCDGTRSCKPPPKQQNPQPQPSQPQQMLQDYGPPTGGVGPP